MKAEPIIVEQVYRSTVEHCWQAITDENQMKQWFFPTMDSFKPQVGFETQFNVQARDKNYLHIWKVTQVVPGRKIVYSWNYGGYPGDSLVIWELTSEGHTTKLKLTCEGLETFPQDNPDFSRESCIEGWNFFLSQRLKTFLEGQQ